MKERITGPVAKRGKRIASVGALSMATLLGAGCGDAQSSSWKLDATCPDGKELNVSEMTSRAGVGSFVLTCADEKDSIAPMSIELVEGPDAVASSNSELNHNIEISTTHESGGLGGRTPRIHFDTDNEQGATTVGMSGIDSLDSVDIVIETEDSKE